MPLSPVDVVDTAASSRQSLLYTLPLTTQLLPPARGVWYTQVCCTRTRPLGGDREPEPYCERAPARWGAWSVGDHRLLRQPASRWVHAAAGTGPHGDRQERK